MATSRSRASPSTSVISLTWRSRRRNDLAGKAPSKASIAARRRREETRIACSSSMSSPSERAVAVAHHLPPAGEDHPPGGVAEPRAAREPRHLPCPRHPLLPGGPAAHHHRFAHGRAQRLAAGDDRPSRSPAPCPGRPARAARRPRRCRAPTARTASCSQRRWALESATVTSLARVLAAGADRARRPGARRRPPVAGRRRRRAPTGSSTRLTLGLLAARATRPRGSCGGPRPGRGWCPRRSGASPRSAATKRALASSRLTRRGTPPVSSWTARAARLETMRRSAPGHPRAVEGVGVNLLGAHRAEVVAHHHALGDLGLALDAGGQLGLAQQDDRRARALGARVGEQAHLVERARVEALGLVDRQHDAPALGRRDSRGARAGGPARRAAEPPAGSAPVAGSVAASRAAAVRGGLATSATREALAVEGLAQGLGQQGLARRRSPR